MTPAAPLLVEHLGFGANAVPYQRAWDRQRELHTEVAAGGPDRLLLLEHEPVYTAGRRTEAHERPWDGAPVVDVDRGGKITWHGPGQIVGYPILRLAQPVDVVAYVRRLERVLIDVCTAFGVTTGRVPGRSGVWVTGSGADRKVAAIGVRVARGVTTHGFALNCDPDLSWYTRIVPCGLPDAGVTSLSAELGRDLAVADVLPVLERHLLAADLPGHAAAGGGGPRGAGAPGARPLSPAGA